MKIAKTLGIALLGTALAVGAAAAQDKSWDKIRIATEGAYAPWNFSGPDGKLQGFEIDLANDLCERMKAECTIVAQDWDGIIPALTAGKYDAIIAGMSITEERRKVIEFSEAYARSPNALLVEKGSDLADLPHDGERFNLDTQADAAKAALEAIKPKLKGKTIGVQVSTTHANFAEEYLKDAAEIREYKTTEQHDLDLTAGRIDAILADSPTIRATLEKPEFKDNYVIAGPGFTGGILGMGVGIGVRQGDPELKAKLDEAIASAIADGTVKRLSEQWFGFDLTPQG